MRHIIDALLAALRTSTPYEAYYVTTPEKPPAAYLLLWSSSGVPGPEQAVTGPGDLTDRIGVTHVATTPLGVLKVRQDVRAVLDGWSTTVAGDKTWLTLAASQRTDVDRDVHPPRPFGVDLYDLGSVPA